MDILQAFKLYNEEIQINIQGTLEEPLFQANQIGRLLEISNIRENLRDFDDTQKVVSLTDTLKGSQKTIFLTELGLYRLLGRSRKPIANIFQNWMIKVLKELRINGIYELKKENDVENKLIKYNSDLKIHKILLKLYDNKNVVYLCKLKEIDDKFIIKIGSSQSLKERLSHITTSFNLTQILLLSAIESDNITKFERFLHKNEFIKNYYYPIEMKNSSQSKETYLVNQEQLDEILKIIDNNKIIYQNKEDNLKEVEQIKLKTEELKKENEKLSIEKENIKLKKKEIDFQIKKIELELLNSKITNNKDELIKDSSYSDNESDVCSDTESETDIDITTCNFEIKTRKNGIKTPKVYQYNTHDLSNPIKIFDSPTEVERENPFISPSPLRIAAKNNTIYKNYRWLFLLRTETLPDKIPDTVEIKHKSPEIKYIAMIDIQKTKILQVFANQKDAVEARNLKSRSFTRAIQQESISSGHYWKFWEDCTEEMKTEYLQHNKLPEKYKKQSGKRVIQIDPKTNEELKTYDSQRDVIKLFQMSSTTLKNISKNGSIHNGYKWKII
jgi:prophage antirepressor-like protein